MHPIIAALLLAPMTFSLMLWAGLGWWFWDPWTAWVETHLAGWAVDRDLGWLAAAMSVGVVLLLLAPLVIVTAVLISALLAMPVLLSHVAKSDYPVLERRNGGTVIGSIWNAAAAIGTFVLLWLITLPLWLLGPVGAVIGALLSAQLNQRLFRYDALSEHASAEEMETIFVRAKGRLILLGLVTGLLYFIPLVNLVAPVFAALAFIHLCLRELQELRAGSGPVSRAGTTQSRS